MADEDFMDDDGDTGDGDEGIFGDPGDVLDRETQSSRNPQITRDQEQQAERMPGAEKPEPRRDLVFAQDAFGRLMVAWAVNGNLAEPFRAPTAEEIKLAPKARWRPVPQQPAQAAGPQMPGAMPGAQVIPQSQPQPAALGYMPMGQAGAPATNGQGTSSSESGFGGLLVRLIAIAAVGYAGWSAWQWYKAQDRKNGDEGEDIATEGELAEAEDVEEVTEV